MGAGMFKKIAGASATGGGNNIRDGKYVMMVEQVIAKENYKKEDLYIVELRVVSAEATGDLDDKGQPVKPNPVGSTASLICNLTQFDNAAGNAKAFVLGALGGLGYTEEQITEEVMHQTSLPQQPLRGMAVQCETYRGVNRGRRTPANQGKPLTLLKWRSIEQTPDQIKAQREYLDAKPSTTPAQKPDASAPVETASVATAPVAATPSPAPAAEAPLAGGFLSALMK